MPPSLSSDLFRYLPQYWPQSEPSGGQGTLLIAPAPAPAPEHGPSLPSSHAPFLLSRSWKNAQIRAGEGGREEGREERWMEREEKMAKDLGDVFKADLFERGWSRPRWTGGVGGSCWGHLCRCVSRGGAALSAFFNFSGDIVTASRCGSAHAMTYFLPFFTPWPSLHLSHTHTLPCVCYWHPPTPLSPRLPLIFTASLRVVGQRCC